MKPNKLLKSPDDKGGKFGAEFSQTFRALRHRDFRLYCAGQVVSLCGTWMQVIALSWLVYRLTGSAQILGLVSFASGLPLLLFTYFGGMIADKFNRKTVLYTTLSLAMAQAATLGWLTYTGQINTWLIVALAVCGGVVTAIEMPTRQAFIPDMVPEEELTNAIGLNSAIWNTSRTIGPALAGLIIGILGEAACFGINSFSFMAALASLLLIKTGSHKKEDNPSNEIARNEKSQSLPPLDADQTGDPAKVQGKSNKQNTSISALLFSPPIRNILLLSAATSMFGFQYGVLLPMIVDLNLGGGASILGLLSASAGTGALLGSLFLASRGNPGSLRRGIGFTGIGLGIAIATIAFSDWVALSMAAAALAGACISIQLSGGTSLIQAVVSKNQRGRVMGVFSTCMVGFSPFAAMLAGILAELVGLQWTLLLSASAVLIAAAAYLLLTSKSD